MSASGNALSYRARVADSLQNPFSISFIIDSVIDDVCTCCVLYRAPPTSRRASARDAMAGLDLDCHQGKDDLGESSMRQHNADIYSVSFSMGAYAMRWVFERVQLASTVLLYHYRLSIVSE